jgi:hypothetical protein
MDDDVKTLLAILALIYGSSNGVGLFKAGLDPVQAKTTELETALKDSRSDASYVRDKRNSVLRSLWAFGVLIYVVLVLVPTLFLGLVVWIGPDAALSTIGLAGDGKPSTGPRGSLFYWILLGLSAVSALQLLSGYLKAWRVATRAWFKA